VAVPPGRHAANTQRLRGKSVPEIWMTTDGGVVISGGERRSSVCTDGRLRDDPTVAGLSDASSKGGASGWADTTKGLRFCGLAEGGRCGLVRAGSVLRLRDGAGLSIKLA
jgi:hypothetical protein